MLYKCYHCNYYSNRLSNLVRHQNKLFPCNKTSNVNPCNIEDDQNVMVDDQNVMVDDQNVMVGDQNVTVDDQNVMVDDQNVMVDDQNVTVDDQNVTVDDQNVTVDDQNVTVNDFKCNKCNKIFSRFQRLKQHEEKCDGLDPRQCRVCLKVFATRQGKYEHMKYVKCTPPIPTSSNTTNNINNNSHNNTNNNIDNSINTNNNIEINIRADFDKISNEHIQRIVSQIKQSDYLQMISNNIDIGKYVIPRTMEQIYFNDKFPEMQTLKKERRNDKLVDVHVGNGKWEKRLIDDISKKIVGRIEDFHYKYLKFIEDKYKDVKVGSPRWKQIMRHIKTFGNTMLWYEGFSGDNIESMGIQLNYPDEDDDEMEKMRDKRNKEMEQLISEKVYDETLSKSVYSIKGSVLLSG
jgi:hypothetical protein